MPACFCYIVRCADDSLYTGWTFDLERRLKAHNAGRGGHYTRSRLPVSLVYAESQKNRLDAMRRERAIKAYPRAKKLMLIRYNRGHGLAVPGGHADRQHGGHLPAGTARAPGGVADRGRGHAPHRATAAPLQDQDSADELL